MRLESFVSAEFGRAILTEKTDAGEELPDPPPALGHADDVSAAGFSGLRIGYEEAGVERAQEDLTVKTAQTCRPGELGVADNDDTLVTGRTQESTNSLTKLDGRERQVVGLVGFTVRIVDLVLGSESHKSPARLDEGVLERRKRQLVDPDKPQALGFVDVYTLPQALRTNEDSAGGGELVNGAASPEDLG